ncbi:MAG TPA: ABC transporter ATP-binding protein [Acidimicrobiia bacterium]|jgi:ABC-2 type transport system ATP-binding protein|nr:ABC transporter ATP-binding protein [Acidimicrobiia bacterium]
MADAVITVQGLRKRYGQHEAVKGIDFTVDRGEVFGFLGTNGAGKTTTIEILEGYRSRTAGVVSVLGVDPARPTTAWRERIGLVLQESELDPLHTVRETVAMFACYYRHPRPVDDTIALVGLAEQRDARVGSLSGGQKRRVDVALGIVGDPDLVFLDEPTTGFDPQARRDAWNMIEGLRQLGKTIFLTTHYMDEAQHLADRLCILRDGLVVAQGTTSDLTSRANGGVVVRFRIPAGVSVDAVRAACDVEPEVSGTEITLKTDHPQRTLYTLTGWAEGQGVELEGLEVTRPTLDDVFLELNAGGQS